jgi:hypothetical protein
MRTGVGVQLRITQILHNLGDGLDVSIPLDMSVHYHRKLPLTARSVTYILKFPPTKNWRAMIAICE